MLSEKDEALYAIIGRNVSCLMDREEISARMMAEWAGLSLATVCSIRRNRAGMGYAVHNLAKIAAVLQVSMAWLMEEHSDVGDE